MKLNTKLIIDKYVGGCGLIIVKGVVILLGWILRLDHTLPKLNTGKGVTFVKYLGGGSIVMCYPSFLALKRAGYRLSLITSIGIVPFAEILGIFDAIYVVDDRKPWALVRTVSKLLFRFRSETCVDLEMHSNLSCLSTAFYGFKNRVGFYVYDSFWRRGIYTHGLYYNPASNISLAYELVAKLFEARKIAPLEIRDAFRGNFGSLSADYRGYVAIAPGCSQLGRERQLFPYEWVELLRDEKRPVVILGGRADTDVGEFILKHKQGKNLAGQLPLRESLAVLFSCDKLYCIDSALLHCARLKGIPVESWWGPTNPAHRILNEEQAAKTDIFHYQSFSCSPCVHIATKCPCGGTAECMRAFILKQDNNPIRGFRTIQPTPSNNS